MFKVKNPTEVDDEVDTEFWLEGDNQKGNNGCILLKVKRSDQKQDFTIASISKYGMLVWHDVEKDLGFEIVKENNGLLHIKVEYPKT